MGAAESTSSKRQVDQSEGTYEYHEAYEEEEEEVDDFNEDEDELDSVRGLRVMRVWPGSPAARAGLTPFEDFILLPQPGDAEPGETDEVPENDGAASAQMARWIEAHQGRDLALRVWNGVDREGRTVSLRPERSAGPGLLGAAVRLEPLKGACEGFWHVLHVQPTSPAAEAGLLPNSDYILGTPQHAFREPKEFMQLVTECHRNSAPTILAIYSSATGRHREIELTPRRDWGGRGLVGAELANGALHRIPRRTSQSSHERRRRASSSPNLLRET
uniref:PDZ GRASP-type domain-containing protein n=1 Tax=Compsopogon caeruleus TaxID=31354 RepID=A0A7S1XH94_9RHOD|mmetsp:Transcript_8373/g.17051  ORF Transcript_8373/g.17051 Transcript_8373/m.17051 type:complete len:274 (+) Transcript_8373:92-913(+)